MENRIKENQLDMCRSHLLQTWWRFLVYLRWPDRMVDPADRTETYVGTIRLKLDRCRDPEKYDPFPFGQRLAL